MKKMNQKRMVSVCLLSLIMSLTCLSVNAEETDVAQSEIIHETETGQDGTADAIDAVNETAADFITSDETEVGLKPGETKQLKYSIEPETSDEKPVFILEYNHNSCITLDEEGVVSALNTGDASVRAELSNGYSIYYHVYVYTDPTSMSLRDDGYPAIVGQGKFIFVNTNDWSSQYCPKTFVSSDSSVVSIPQDGKPVYSGSVYVNAVGAGTATITATSSNGISCETKLTVLDGDYAQFINTVGDTEFYLKTGETAQLEYSLYSYNGGSYADEKVTFEVTSGTEYASVSDTGLVTAVAGGGTAYIDARITNGSSVQYRINVSDLPESISFEKTEYMIPVGDTAFFRVLTEPASASNCKKTYTSSDSSIAEVVQQHMDSYVLKGNKEGIAVITAETENGLKAQTVAKVVDGYANSISFADYEMYLSLNESKQVEYTLSSNTGNTSKEQLKWSVTDGDDVISVDQNGIITASGYGKAEIMAETVLGYSATCTVYVAKQPENLRFPVETVTLQKGKNMQIFAFSDSPDSDNWPLTYTSDNLSVADVIDYGHGGVGWLSGKETGTAVITASAGNGISAQLKVIVEEGEYDRYPSASFNYEVLSVGEQFSLSRYEKMNLAVSDPSVAIINNGYLTALKPGYACVYAAAEDGRFLSETVHIYVHGPLTGIGFKEDQYYLYKGYTMMLREYLDIFPKDELVDDIYFTTSNDQVVQINYEQANAIGTGTAVITAYTADGLLQASATIHVGNQLTPSGIELDEPQPVKLNLGFIRQPKLKITPIYTDQTDYILTSDHPEIVEVATDKFRNVQMLNGKKPGSATVTAVLKSDPSKSVTFPVTVEDGEGRNWHESAVVVNTTQAVNEQVDPDENNEFVCYTGDSYTIFSRYISTHLQFEDTVALYPIPIWTMRCSSETGSIKMYPPQAGYAGAYRIFDQGGDWKLFTAIRPGTAKIYIAGNRYITIRVVDRQKEISADIYGCSLNLEGKVGLNYYLEMPEDDINDLNIRLTSNGKDRVIPAKDGTVKMIDGKNYRMYSYETAAKEMNDDIILKVEDKDGNPVTLTKDGEDYTEGYVYSARMYFEKAKESGSEKLKPLAKALETYGKYAQLYFNYHTEQVKETEDVTHVTADTLKKYRPLNAGSVEGLSYLGGSMELNSDTSLRIYFSLEEGHKISEYSFTVNNEPADAELRSGNQYYVTLNNIAAKDLGKAITVTTEKGDDMLTVIYYPLSYAYTALSSDKTGDAIKNTCRALYLYNQAAIAYFGTK